MLQNYQREKIVHICEKLVVYTIHVYMYSKSIFFKLTNTVSASLVLQILSIFMAARIIMWKVSGRAYDSL